MTFPAGEVVAAGRTVLTARALHHLAVGVVRDAAGVSAREVAVSISDERGMMKADVTVPVTLDTQLGTFSDRGTAIQRALIEGMDALAGRQVRAVNVRFSGLRQAPRRRVI